ncbi:MAG: periplasmic heavy metal sensor [Nitrospirae bacterium]|nr:MAG: periplasmic heavy metal sensor [Nitrospirota bacterium]
MKVKFLTGAVAMIAVMLGLSLLPARADVGSGHGKAYGAHRSSTMMGHQGGAGHFLRHLLKHQKEIGLTEDQVARLKAIHLELDRTRIRTEAEVLVAERELATMVQDDKTDLAAIEAKVKQSEALEAGLRLAAIKAKRDAMALLTPEQREKEKSQHEKMIPHRREG